MEDSAKSSATPVAVVPEARRKARRLRAGSMMLPGGGEANVHRECLTAGMTAALTRLKRCPAICGRETAVWELDAWWQRAGSLPLSRRSSFPPFEKSADPGSRHRGPAEERDPEANS
ncbi:hypothetical protein Mro03_50120 [Microbispora rosea subsp. rosea]|nr:hypothetical protein Mro03_50120 [Microbispora rosea subsp. rosea]